MNQELPFFMIQSIIFDLGGVLVKDPVRNIINYISKELRLDKKSILRTYRKYNEDMQKGKIKQDMFLDNMKKEHNIDIKNNLLYDAFKNAYQEIPIMVDMARKLHGNNYKIGLLSNTEDYGARIIRERNFEFIDIYVLSCEKGTRKPEKKIYEIALDELHVKPDEAIFLDDKPANVDAFKNMGGKGITVRKGEEEQAVKELESMLKFNYNLF